MPRQSFDRDGVPSSRVQLTPGPWKSLLDGLCAQFPAIPRDRWSDRFARGRVLDDAGRPVAAEAPYQAGLTLHYFREVGVEARVAGDEVVVHIDDRLVVVDKPHGLAVMPGGRFVEETLLVRLARRLGNPRLVPLHRLDRGTAGLVLFSADPASRDQYHALFRDRGIAKRYEARAPALPGTDFPLVRRSRIVRGEPFFRMREADGAANSETVVSVADRASPLWRYDLEPVTGRKHQLRVHMSALGAPIAGDRLYPDLLEPLSEGQAAPPLQLLARAIRFRDPVDGTLRSYESQRRL